MKSARRLLVIAIFNWDCDPSSLDPESLVNSVRVLAVQADKPFAEPGEVVHLLPLLADPLGEGRAIQFAWGTCINPGSQEIADCAASVSSFETKTGFASPSPFDVTVPATALDHVAPELPLGSVGVIFAACAGTLTVQSLAGVPVTCTDSQGRRNHGDTFNWGEKRIVVIRGLRNTNPAIERIRLDGATWFEGDVPALSSSCGDTVDTCDPTAGHSVRMEVTKDSKEDYLGRTEDLVGYFFASQGTMNDAFSRPSEGATTLRFDTSIALTKPDRSRPILFWFVVRDDRGGVEFTTRQATLR